MKSQPTKTTHVFVPSEEKWKQIEGHEHYEISSHGRVRRTDDKRLKVLKVDRKGYHEVTLHTKTKRRYFKVHRLVAQAFIPNPESKAEVNHMNGITDCNHVENLEWATRKENMLHAKEEGLMPSGEKHPRSVLTRNQVEEIRSLYIPRDKQYSGTALAKKFGVSNHCIHSVVTGRSWAN